jgi:hypothetical protein
VSDLHIPDITEQPAQVHRLSASVCDCMCCSRPEPCQAARTCFPCILVSIRLTRSVILDTLVSRRARHAIYLAIRMKMTSPAAKTRSQEESHRKLATRSTPARVAAEVVSMRLTCSAATWRTAAWSLSVPSSRRYNFYWFSWMRQGSVDQAAVNLLILCLLALGLDALSGRHGLHEKV